MIVDSDSGVPVIAQNQRAIRFVQESHRGADHPCGVRHCASAEIANDGRERRDFVAVSFSGTDRDGSGRIGRRRGCRSASLLLRTPIHLREQSGRRRRRTQQLPLLRYAEPPARVVFSKTQSSQHLNTAIARIKLGRTLLRQKRFAEAEAESRAGYDILRAQLNPSVSWLNSARQDLIAVYDALGLPDKAAGMRVEMASTAK